MGNTVGSGRRLRALHFVARADEQKGKLVPLGDGVFESGNWAVAESTAALARGAILHLHERQDEPSWFAGTIIGSRPSDTVPGRTVWKFTLDRSLCCRQREGWSQEQARVWEE